MSEVIFPEKVLEQHIAVLGKTGAGKTSTEKLLIETVVADDFRVCVLDTVKSDWWGITSSASGKRPGLPFKILGGPRGHVPLHASAGKVIGQLVGSGKLPLSIVDMADFEAGGIQKFFVDFAPSLMRSMRGVVYLVIEEAHEVAPKERAGFGAENLAIHYAKKLATAGRSKGIRLIVATQRVQSLHNAVLGSCETVIAHRLTTPADQEPVLKWLKANADKETQEKVAASISSLPTGTGWMCSGEAKVFEMVKFPKFATYDNTATPTGDGEEISVKTATVDQDELRSIIGEAVEEAKANDPRELRRRIADLEKQIRVSAPKPASGPTAQLAQAPARMKEKRVEVPVMRERDFVRLEKLCNRMMEFGTDLAHGVGTSIATISGHHELQKKALETLGRPAAASRIIQHVSLQSPTLTRPSSGLSQSRGEARAPARVRENVETANDGELRLTGGYLAVLKCAAQFPDGVTDAQLGVMTGYKKTSRGEFKKGLVRYGYAVKDGDKLVATEKGITALGDNFEPLPTGDALREHWLQELSGGELELLKIYVEAYPNEVPNTEIIGNMALNNGKGYQKTSVGEFKKHLVARKLIVNRGGAAVATDQLFG